jgi:hypothetical protein
LSWRSYNRSVPAFIFGLVQGLISNLDKVDGTLDKVRIELGYAATDRHTLVKSQTFLQFGVIVAE